ncbi:MAG: CHRD domain-containing protein [Deltaproteobacteria bacterium]|nr:CHRD domain-containing protein [Myxococcales bacterium]MDP3221087.1 CHRD domain-containing protein [Deltaproteobacteria bacterium]
MNIRPLLLLCMACGSLGFSACSVSVTPPGPAEFTPSAPPTGDESANPLPEVGTPPKRGPATMFNATMTGREQVPPVYGTSATGTGSFALSADRTSLDYTVEHTLEAPTEAHLHIGIAGESGAVLLPLTVAPGTLSGTVPVTPDQAWAIEQGRAYVDVHSAEHPDGEIRGQVVRPGEIVYVTRLTPDQVNPPTDAPSHGLGELLVDGTANSMRFVVQVQGMVGEPTRAFVGIGPAGVDGPIAVDLAEPKTLPAPSFSGERALTSTTDLDLGRWYIDIRSRRHPNGEVRGQVLRPGQELYLGRLSGAEVVPPVNSSARGSVSVIVDVDRDRVIYDVALTDMVPTEGRLAEGAPGEVGPAMMPFEVLGTSFRAREWLPPGSTLLSSLASGHAYAAVASESFPEGELRGQMLRVGLPR